ncbi:hypothetical protein BDY24DRAFT_45993 [Mrakia frigida]|uniref:ubiquitin-associated domain-containing protein n=1 Tax=Mrakia frigida TaxID=29902 RepID=UPI003FCC0C6F
MLSRKDFSREGERGGEIRVLSASRFEGAAPTRQKPVAFGDAEDRTSDEDRVTPTNIYAPPPTQQQETPSTPTRPALPQRKTAAEPDDIPDVKTIVGMGFSRSEALNALEVGDYNLQKAIDHLVSK